MMRSMFSGVSGLRAHQTRMDVIGNNIANVNTVGFKSGRVTFQEIFSQTLRGAGAPDAATGRGGTNPMQVGLGLGVGAVDTLMTRGSLQRTDNPTDLSIEGEGFFIVKGGSEYNKKNTHYGSNVAFFFYHVKSRKSQSDIGFGCYFGFLVVCQGKEFVAWFFYCCCNRIIDFCLSGSYFKFLG